MSWFLFRKKKKDFGANRLSISECPNMVAGKIYFMKWNFKKHIPLYIYIKY